jgi:hypothetical protein
MSTLRKFKRKLKSFSITKMFNSDIRALKRRN